MQPAQEGAFPYAPPSAGTVQIEVSSRHQDLLALNSAVEETAAQLPPEGAPGIGHNQPPLTGEEISDLRRLLAGIKATPTKPPQQPSSTEKETASKLKSYAAKVTNWVKEVANETAKDAVKEFWRKLGGQLIALGKAYLKYVFSGGEPPADFYM